ncbi:MAG: beta-galactosidase [Candidatus Omnitrophica bacterium]|nr:beta-galactosidase [Candidatus Omnitrophota bacterium]
MEKIFGGEIQYFRLEDRYWEKVVEKLKESGLNFVSTYIPWGIHEIKKGIFDFEGRKSQKTNLIKFLEIVKKYELKIAVRPGPFICNEFLYGGYPERIVKENPEIFVLDYQNRHTKGYWIPKKEGSQPSYLHPKYLEECETWLSAVSEVIKPYLSINGGPIEMINLDNEVSYITMDSMFDSDYNECMVGKDGYYYKFLKNKYKDVVNLPKVPFYNVKEFEDIQAPRNLVEVEKNLIYYFDWIEFKEWVMAEYLKRLREIYEKNGIKGVTFYTNLNPHRPEGVPTNPKKFEDAVKGIVGYDFYRNPFLSFSGYVSMARVLRYLESVLKFTWSAEFMAGWWFEDISKCWLTYEHHKFMSLSAISNGCKGIFYFMFHDRETWGGSPVSDKGHIRSVYYGIKDFLSIVNKFEDWENLKINYDKIGLIYYRPYHWHTYLGDPSPCNDNSIYVGQPVMNGLKAGLLTKEYEGIFRLLLLAGYSPRIVDIIDSSKKIKDCKVLIFTTGTFLDKKTEKLLIDFVKNGGVLVTGPFIPEFTPEGEKIVQIKNILNIKFSSKIDKLETDKISLNQFFLDNYNENFFKVGNLPVLNIIRYGKGKIYFLRGLIGQSEPLDEPEGNINLIHQILKRENINPCLSHSWGNRGTPMTMSAYIGGKVIFGKDTVWFEKVIDDWRKFKVEFKEENFWVNASKKLLEKQIEKSNREFLITMPDFGDALTCFSLLKGVENLLIDIIEIPDLIIEKIYEFVNAWIKTHKFFHSIYSKKIIGDTTWLLWAPGRTYACQSDFSTMISPKLFEKFVVFELEILSEYLEYMAWHLDGPDEIKHLDILLSLPYIKVIQIVPGAGRPPCASPLWLPIIDKILKNGKNVITYASNKEEFEILIKSFYSGKILISCGIVDIEDQKQKEFFNFVEKYI